MTESTGTGNNLEKPTPTLEQQELISKTTVPFVKLLDFYNNRKDEDILRQTNQLVGQIDDLVIRGVFENLGIFLNNCNKGGDESASRKERNLSRRD